MGNSISNEVSALVGGVADEVTHALGVGDWYSLHVMDACEGYYKTGSSYNVTSCTASGPNSKPPFPSAPSHTHPLSHYEHN